MKNHLLAAARYIEMNPVAAELVKHPDEFRWSSARAHLKGRDDKLVKIAPLLGMVNDWKRFLSLSSEEEVTLLHRHERTGRPLGGNSFIENLEGLSGRRLRPKEPEPKKENYGG